MKLKRLQIKNIRSYESQEIIFPEGSLLLAGDVGSGKTSLLLAIEYALFGLQPGQAGLALLRNNTSIGEVLLELEIDGKDIIIERKLRKGSKTVVNDYASLTQDGLKKEYSITELKTKILKLLHYPSEFIKKNNLLYRYTVYTPQEQMKQIIVEDAETRLNILRHIFGIDKYKMIRENAQLITTKLKEEVKTLQGEIKSLDADKIRLESTKTSIHILENKVSQQNELLKERIVQRKTTEQQVLEIEKRIKEKESLETELEKAKVLWASKKERLHGVNQEYLELQKRIADLESPQNQELLQEIIAKLAMSSSLMDNLQSAYIDISSQGNALEQRRTENIRKKERIFKIDFCPTCLQNVPEVHKHNIMNETEREVTALMRALQDLEKKKQELAIYIEKEKKEVKKLEEKKVQLEILKSKQSMLEQAQKKIQEIDKNKESLQKDINLLEAHVNALKENILGFQKFQNQWKVKQEELKKAFLGEKQVEINRAELLKELELTHKEITLLQQALTEKEKSKKKLDDFLELNDWLTNHFLQLVNFIEQQVMMKLRIEFSKLFSAWFHMIAGESLEVQLDENFTPVVMQGDTEMDYTFLSGGERTALALAYRLALNQTINSLLSQIKTRDLVILDEPTEGFSETQIDKIRDVFEELNVQQLIIVSHEQKIEGFVDHVLRLKKEGDTSFMDTTTASISIPEFELSSKPELNL